MAKYSMHQAKSQLSKLVEDALMGKEIVIARRNVPAVVLVPYAVQKRKLGIFAGKGKIHDSFDDPIEGFEGYLPLTK